MALMRAAAFHEQTTVKPHTSSWRGPNIWSFI